MSVVKKFLVAVVSFLGALVVSFALIAAVFYMFGLNKQPNLPAPNPVTSQDVNTAKTLAKRTIHGVQHNPEGTTLIARNDEITSALKLLNRRFPELRAQVNLDNQHGEIAFSLGLQRLRINKFLNGTAHFTSVDSQLKLSGVTLGKLPVPSWLVNFLAWEAAYLALGRDYVSSIASNFSAINIHTEYVSADYAQKFDHSNVLARLAQRYQSFKGQNYGVESAQIAKYMTLIHTHFRTYEKLQLDELLNFAGPHIFKPSATPAELQGEMRAFLLAATIYVAPHEIAPVFNYLGYFKSRGEKNIYTQLKAKTHPSVTLLRRSDLAKHFLVSAALHILGDKSLSYEIGQLKEVFDSRKGGSGFSFYDLAADRSGTLFAISATGNHAASFAAYLAQKQLKEEHLFPLELSLKEGLTETEFVEVYGHLGSPGYQRAVNEIDEAILKNTIFNTHAN